MTIAAAARTTRWTGSTRSIGWVQLALFALVLVPSIAGSLRLVELAGGPHLIPANPSAGTQVFTQGIGPAVFGSRELTTDLSLGAGWAINLAVAECIIGLRRSRRNVSRRSIRATAEVGSS
jgi:hypothetical protein